MSNMKIGAMLFVASAAFSSVSFAGGMATYPESVDTGPGKAHEQIVQEMLEIRRNPVLGAWPHADTDAGWTDQRSPQAGKSRELVLRELQHFLSDRLAQEEFSKLYGGA